MINSLDARSLRAPGGAIDGLSNLTAELLRGPREARRLQLEADRQAESDRRASVMEAIATQRALREEDDYRARGIANGTVEADPGNPAEWNSYLRGKRLREIQAATEQLNADMLRGKAAEQGVLVPDADDPLRAIYEYGLGKRITEQNLRTAQAKQAMNSVDNGRFKEVQQDMGSDINGQRPKKFGVLNSRTGEVNWMDMPASSSFNTLENRAGNQGSGSIDAMSAPTTAGITKNDLVAQPSSGFSLTMRPSGTPGINTLGDLTGFRWSGPGDPRTDAPVDRVYDPKVAMADSLHQIKGLADGAKLDAERYRKFMATQGDLHQRWMNAPDDNERARIRAAIVAHASILNRVK